MPFYAETHRADLIDKIVEAADRRLGTEAAAPFRGLLERYYANVPYHDIHDEGPETLLCAAFTHWRLGQVREAETTKVRVYNPTLEEHGWHCEHTVVEVVTDDMPFLVDSVSAALSRQGLAVHLVIHPIVRVHRGADGTATKVANADADDVGPVESFMHFEVTQRSGKALAEIADTIESVLGDVRAAVADWAGMRARLRGVIDGLAPAAEWLGEDEVNEIRDFLEWIYNNHFTFLGCREYAFASGGADATISVVRDSGLGLLRDPETTVFHELRDLASMPPAVQAFVQRPDLLVLTKTNQMSTVHRPVLMDSIGVKRFDAEGRVIGQYLFVGLFTSVAYSRSLRDIPVLRRKIARTFERAGLLPKSHDAKSLLHILETFPRDELFHVSEEHLLRTSLGILHLQERQRVALFLRRDDFERFIACQVYVPRDRYSTDLRTTIQKILERAFAGEIASHHSSLGDSPFAHLHLIVQTTPGEIPDYDADELEAAIVDAARTWPDRLEEALIVAHGEELGQQLQQRYADAFPPGYEERFNAEQAVADIEHIEESLESGDLGMTLYRPFGAADHQLRFKLFHADGAVPLSQILPMLENLGLIAIDEVPHAVRANVGDGRTVLIHDFGVEPRSGQAVDLGAVRANFQDALLDVWHGAVENDGFNSLVLEAGLSCREAVIVRAYCKYLRQAGIAFSQAYMEQTLAGNLALTRRMVELFACLFDPQAQKDSVSRAETIREEIAADLDRVESADQDRIIRRFVNAIESTLRTNAYQRSNGGEPKPYVAFKIDSRRVDELPLPRPLVEVFVYSPRVEAIHLRGGKVARGGIRWSDRREDFRTEVLGLMKAQMVKNAVIVPVGAKGGFVVKRPPADREALAAEGIECYRTFIRGLLDIADNLAAGRLVPPADVVRWDDDDPYLVVAADKGTATFSDIANTLAAEHGFWLGDAFASGGSQGYDHKGMGITARGAWESVKRHFREVGLDTQSQPFTVVGVGDMSGDVFGNGMLLSRHIRLVAAFNHLHIFVDPDPDPETSFVERERLFQLPRSSWADYDPAKLSPGGEIFDRRAKTLRPSAEIKAAFGIEADRLTPAELIRVLLKAEVDLLWFGGIGTYVKSRYENHADVGDRTNDGLRVDAAELRCRVVGEGANLGLTQLGRIEFAQAGGRINTDFIDNSAGVDTSDHEVNIKILLDAMIADGDMTGKQRNGLLAQMTDEVASLVLRNNYLQTQAISLIAARGAEVLDQQVRLMRMLERRGGLNRTVEMLPDDEALTERAAAGQGLTRPEVAVLFCHCKMWLYDEMLDSDLPEDRHLAEDVVRYFPSALAGQFVERIAGHRLRRELIATTITNSLINRVGGTFVIELREKTGMPAMDITRAYLISRDVFRLREVWEAIEALDNVVPARVQMALHRDAQRLIELATMWFLRNGGPPLDISGNIAAFADGIAHLGAVIATVLPDRRNAQMAARSEAYRKAEVPEDLAERAASLGVMVSACDIVRIAASHGIPMEDVARLYFAVGETFGFSWLREQAESRTPTSYWEKLAVAAVMDELFDNQRHVVQRVLKVGGHDDIDAIESWSATCRPSVERARSVLAELESAGPIDLSMLAVASRRLRALTEVQ